MLRLATAAGVRLVRARCQRQDRHFHRQLADCERTQRNTLRRLLRLNAGTRFQQDHHLTPGLSSEQYRRCLPLTTFDDVAPYVQDVVDGDVSALCGRRNRPLMFAQTSGTTGCSKLIPITRSFLNDYRRGWNIWAFNTFERHPRIPLNRFLQIISDFDRQRTPSGLPCGNITGLVQSMQSPFVQTRFVLPAAVVKVHEPAAKAYLTLRLALAVRTIGLISTANPSTLVQLAQLADAEQESLIRDISDGTLAEPCGIPQEIRRRLRRRLRRKHSVRARELARIAERTGHLYPRDFWPDTSLIAVWTGGSAAAYLPQVRELYGDVPIRDHGLAASEGRMTISLEDETASGVLDIASHFFEFVPEEHIDKDNPETLLAHELEPGRSYFIILTTASGLSRYNISDVVRCTGFLGTTPRLQFLHKGAHISNVTGEKLTESQVVAAVGAASAQVGCRLSHYTICPVWGHPPAYRLLVEESDLSDPVVGDQLVATVEQQLRAANCEYHDKRDSGRLGPLGLQRLPAGTWNRYILRQQSRPGTTLEQYKHPCLKPDMSFRDDLLSLVDTPAGFALRSTAVDVP